MQKDFRPERCPRFRISMERDSCEYCSRIQSEDFAEAGRCLPRELRKTRHQTRQRGFLYWRQLLQEGKESWRLGNRFVVLSRPFPALQRRRRGAARDRWSQNFAEDDQISKAANGVRFFSPRHREFYDFVALESTPGAPSNTWHRASAEAARRYRARPRHCSTGARSRRFPSETSDQLR